MCRYRECLKGLHPKRRRMMSKKSWFKWSLLIAGSSVAALQLGSCIANLLLETFVLSAVN